MSTTRHEDIKSLLAGISAIPVTPFNEDGSVNPAQLTKTVERITGSGIQLIVACGNTAEYSSLAPTEVLDITAATIAAAGDAHTIVGVGGDLPSAIDHMNKAAAKGAAGFMIHAPSHAYVSDDGLVDYYRALAETSGLPLVLYVRGREPSQEAMQRLVTLENVIAIKYARRDLMGFARLVQNYGSEIIPICGLAEAWAPFFWLAGGRGFTSGLVNVAPDLSVGLLNALTTGDHQTVRQLWRLIKPFEQMRERHGDALNVPAVKEAMVLRGYLDNAYVRPPISALTPNERSELAEIVRTWDDAGE